MSRAPSRPRTTLLLACLALVLAASASPLSGQVEVIFLDVGQGDAIVIRSPEGKVALLDAGPTANTVALLRRHQIDSIDIAIASHAHSDHIGGMEGVIRSVPVRYFMDNGLPHTTSTYAGLMEAVSASSITYLAATARTIILGSVTLKVLPPPGSPDHNNNSVGLVVEYGEFRAMLTGDSEAEELSHFLSLDAPDVTMLKAPHHGSRDGVTPAWLSATRPEVVVISCGWGNPYGHPHDRALRYYGTVAAEVYRTDLHGEVRVIGFRNGTYEVHAGKTAGPSSHQPAQREMDLAEEGSDADSGEIVVRNGY